MTPEHKGQHIILLVLLILAFSLSYCAVPSKVVPSSHRDNSQSRWILRPWLANLEIWGSRPSPSVKLETVVKDTGREQTAPTPPADKETAPMPEPATETIARAEPADTHDIKDDQKAEPEPAQNGIILMNTPQYASHTKAIVQFPHEQHINEYSIACGACHHDDTGDPLDLKPGDSIQRCIDCHKGTKKKKGEKLSKAEKIMTYHKEALHANCIDCHKSFNIENGDPKGKEPAPVSCKACHK